MMDKYIFGIVIALFTLTLKGQTCNGLTEINDCMGSFHDGSGNSIYSTNLNCAWKISNDSSKQMLLSFENIEIEWGIDIITIFDGADQNAPLLGQLLAPTDLREYISSGHEIYFEFTSDNSVSLQGWNASFACLDGSLGNVVFDQNGAEFSFNNDSLYFEAPLSWTNLEDTTLQVEYRIKNFKFDMDAVFTLEETIDLPANQNGLVLKKDLAFQDLGIDYGSYYVEVVLNPSRIFLESNFLDNVVSVDELSMFFCGSQEFSACIDSIQIIHENQNGVFINASCKYDILPDNPDANHIQLTFDSFNLSEGQILQIFHKRESDPFFNTWRAYDFFNPPPKQVITPNPHVQIDLLSPTEAPVHVEISYECIEDELLDPIILFFDGFADGNILIGFVELLNESQNRVIEDVEANFYAYEVMNGDTTGVAVLLAECVLLGDVLPNFPTPFEFEVDISNVDIPPGNYFIGIEIDPKNKIKELDEGNNIFLSFNNFVIPYCDFESIITECSGTITDGSGPDNVGIETNCTWLLEVPGAEHFRINFTEFDFSDFGAELRVFENNSGILEFVTAFNAGNLPSELVTSLGNIRIEFENFFDESETGWSFDYACDSVAQYNFFYRQEGFNFQLFSGRMQISAVIRNSSSFFIDQVEVAFYLSEDSTIDTNDIQIGNQIFSQMQPRQSEFVFFERDIDDITDGLPVGQYYFGFLIDPKNEYSEINEFDNVGVSENQTIGVSYCSGDNQFTDCTGTITDGSGDLAYSPNSRCEFLIQPKYGDFIEMEFSKLNWTSFEDNIEVFDGTNTNNFLRFIQAFESPGNVGRMTTSQNAAFLVWNTGNSMPSAQEGWGLDYVCRTDRPNLLARKTYEIDNQNNDFTIAYVLKNDSGIFANGFDIHYVLSRDKNFSSSDILLESERIFSMTGAEAAHKIVTLNVDDHLNAIKNGFKYIGVVVDPDNSVSEVLENDNILFFDTEVDVLVPTQEIEFQKELLIYPNPTSKQIFLDWSKASVLDWKEITVRDALGKSVYQRPLTSSNSHHSIDVLHWPAGVYFVELNHSDLRIHQKFIKIKE